MSDQQAVLRVWRRGNYGVSPLNPEGFRGSPTRCKAGVIDRSGLFGDVYNQCQEKIGHGPDGQYCKKHAIEVLSGKRVWTPEEPS